jgi:GTP-binding protein Era
MNLNDRETASPQPPESERESSEAETARDPSAPDGAPAGTEQGSDLDLLARLFGESGAASRIEGHRAGFVALVGRPNAGKSTLLNAFIGEKIAIVSRKPQTTRHQILGILSRPEAQAIFIDTPGLHDPVHALGRSMVKAASAALAAADLVVWVIDVSRPPEPADLAIGRRLVDTAKPMLLALNKADRLPPDRLRERTEEWSDLPGASDWVLTIATTGHNLETLWWSIASRLPEGPPLYPEDEISDQSDRMVAAEIIREAALRFLSEEVPHGIAVTIEHWEERQDGLVKIAAKIIVERSSHKSIVIGRSGQTLKRIGIRARLEIETLLDRRVHLELFVAVRPGWRRDPNLVRDLGYS